MAKRDKGLNTGWLKKLENSPSLPSSQILLKVVKTIKISTTLNPRVIIINVTMAH